MESGPAVPPNNDDPAAPGRALEEHYGDRLRRFLEHMLSTPTGIQRVLQQIYERTLSTASSLVDSSETLNLRIYRVAREYVSERRHEPTTVKPHTLPVGFRMTSRSVDTLTTLIEAGESGRLPRVLEKLAKLDREILLLRFVEGFAAEEVAGILQMEESELEQRLAAALRKIREFQSQEPPDLALSGSRILIADNEPAVLRSLQMVLEEKGYRVATACSGVEALEILAAEPIELLLTDLRMPNMSGEELTRLVVQEWPDVPVIVLTGYGSIEEAVELMKMGAADFLVKPCDPQELLVRLGKQVTLRALRSENRRLSVEVRNARYCDLIGACEAMKSIFAIIEQVARVPSTVLLEGEPGTGKELIARAIHNRSREHQRSSSQSEDEGREPDTRPWLARGRSLCPLDESEPYLAVNCGALSRTLLESQLFGHRRGAFTGAINDQQGFFAAAGRGTLFLDEITELDRDLQVKLLRAVQERQVFPLGTTQPLPFQARLIAATNQPIEELVEQNRFRADLYWRINVVSIRVPPLRERGDDIDLLVDFFIRAFARDYRVAPRRVSPAVMEKFRSYSWPGNVRELQNMIEGAFAIGRNPNEITLADLPPGSFGSLTGSRNEAGSNGNGKVRRLDEVLREHIFRALQASGGVRTRAAELLGLDRNRLGRMIKRHDIDLEQMI